MPKTEIGVEYNKEGLYYIAVLITAAFFIILSILKKNGESLMFSVPVLAVSIYYLTINNKSFRLSPKICLILVVMLFLAHFSNYYIGEESKFRETANLLFGVLFAVLGIILVKIMLRNAPELDRGRAFFVSLCAWCISVTGTEVLKCLGLGMTYLWNPDYHLDVYLFIEGAAMSVLGSFIVCVVFYINKKTGLFGSHFDKLVSPEITAADDEGRRKGIEELILQGESSKLEFKSTVRKNLATGEKDPRMEKAVLKTIVAFLNSRGGTLLIGVADSGEIIGSDEDTFENRDKMLLHLNHLIENKIGKQYLPYIHYFLVDFDGKSVIRVDCAISDSPVFLIEGKEQTFFVRSGPSSIDLHGMDLLKYANHNFGRVIKRSAIGSNNNE